MPDRISDNQGKGLLTLARRAIAQELGIFAAHGQQAGSGAAGPGDRSILKEKRGLFVTLYKQGQLRGCIGSIEPVASIGKALDENARAAAFRDSRFSPLQQEEFHEIDIEISLLSPPMVLGYETPADLVRLLVPHRDGVVLKKGGRRATFLPQVWEQLPTPEPFLSHLCMKAGLSSDAWQTGPLDIFVYRVQSFEENNS